MDALMASNLEDTSRLGEKLDETSVKDQVKMNRMTCLTQDIKYHVFVRDFHKEDVGDSREEVSDEEYRKSIASKRRLYHFQLKRGLSIDEHMNNYMKLLADLINVDVAIEEEDKAAILLKSLPDEEFETFILILING